jgi:hypothetical protein
MRPLLCWESGHLGALPALQFTGELTSRCVYCAHEGVEVAYV